MEVTQSDIIQPLQAMFPDKVIVSILACRGTDRTMGPPSHLDPREAPFRKSLMILRPSGQVAHEKHWERWQDLSHRQLIRPAHACRLNVTIFGYDKELTPDPIHDVPSMDDQSASSSGGAPESPSVPSVPDTPSSQGRTDHQSVATDTPLQEDNHQRSSPRDESPVGPLQAQSFRFQSLPKWEQNQIQLMHRNLGHPSNERLVKALQSVGQRPEVLDAARELRCPACAKHSVPKHQRPGHLKALMDFNHKAYIDGITWTNSQGSTYHFYHMLDAGSNYHVAFSAPSRLATDVIHLINQHWICWAGAPQYLSVDSASELNGEEFTKFTQRLGIRQTTTCPEAHWQHGKIERHGKFIQDMLSRLDAEIPISSYQDLQQSLNQCTQAKNNLSVRHGFSPEIIVFGKQSRVPGSILSDEGVPSHLSAIQEEGHYDFKKALHLREEARRAFHAADNSDNLRRALLRRSCPDRGHYERDQWVMIWRTQNQGQGVWIGPQKVIIQDSNHTIWTTQGGKLYRSAPEHVRRSLPSEGHPEGPEMPLDITTIQQQIQRLNTLRTIPEEVPLNQEAVADLPEETQQVLHPETHRRPSQAESEPQPDLEPDVESQPSASNSREETNSTEQDLILLLSEEEGNAFSTGQESGDYAFRCEFEVPLNEVPLQEPPSEEVQWALLASSAAKQRTEVRLSELTKEERQAFEQAKQSEIANWIQTETITKVLRDQIPSEQVLRCRWILTWKPLDGVPHEDSQSKSLKTHKPKARLVVLGYLDPNIEEIPRDSPTLNKTSRMLILQTISSHSWQLMSFDIKAAFLQGKPQADRLMGLEPVPELRQALQMSSQQIGLLQKGAYGLIDAPYLWYCALVSELVHLGMEVSPFDPCTFVLRDKQDPKKLAGVLGIHVDDGLCGGNEQFQALLEKLEQKYPFGSKKVGSFTFTGIEVSQQPDNSIILSQSSYVRKIKAIPIEVNRKTQPEADVTDAERGLLRGLVGSLQYAAVNTRPDLSSRLSQLQSSINHAKIQNLHDANKLLHEAKRHHDVTVTIKPIPYRDFRFMAFSDASFASQKKPDSHAGLIIVGTHHMITQNVQCDISPISWGSKKIQKVVTSTWSAETTSLAAALDQLGWLRLYWRWLHDPTVEWRKPETTLPQLEPAISVPTLPSDHDLAVTDCKSLYDLVTRTAPPSCQEFRVQLVARSIKESLKEGISLRWVHTGAQLADCLTKAMEATFLRATLKVGCYRLHDETATLRDRARSRDRIKWLHQATNHMNFQDRHPNPEFDQQ